MKTRRILTGLCLACCLAASAAAQGAPAAKADFSGTWVLDASKSEGLPPGVEQTLVVTQQGDRVEAQNTTKGPQGEQVIKDAYVLDGQETDLALGGRRPGPRRDRAGDRPRRRRPPGAGRSRPTPRR